MRPRHILFASALAAATFSCTTKTTEDETTATAVQADDSLQQKLDMYTNVRLTSDLSKLTEKEKQMIPLLIEAADIMNGLFWYEAYGKSDSLLAALDSDPAKRFVNINYGPWDRLNNNEPFIAGVGPKPEGANFYPEDMTKEEFEQANLPDKASQYTFLRRDESGKLITVPYHVQFKEEVTRAADLLRQAANLAEEPGLKKYLNLRAEALLTDNYQPSDLAWMDMKNNTIDVVIGPIETYEDKLFGYKAAHEAYVLVKDQEWSERLAKYAAFLPELQRGLPVAGKYKTETPGTDSDLNAYDVVYYAGDSNAGSKTIAINLPNDEEVQLKKGTRRLQLKNAMRAKFDKIMEPIAEELIVEDQQENVTFDAFFANTMFHEVAHGLGIKNTVNGKGTVREALKEHASALEEGKADILGLYMITQLHEKGELEGDLEDYYTTFLAGIFRSVRFGAASAHGQANMVRFNFFKENGAFERDEATGKYRVNYEKMREAMNKLSEKILTLQGEGDYAGVGELLEKQGQVSPQLQADLDRLAQANIPVDIVFEQGVDVLGL
ncbi:peptidase M49-like protein [Pontibacter ummariensis]|uniref:Peptidase family M49 n=1 Tax=Pontibacter ummariensis TaxID=1610492 RepID=A0A239BF89_9BACT|nr:Zn-dependent hydrolase [Pontibacter ummariensis]PRY16512.1 peptidase M49-like protein [Pontibacter ummariensis]SNS06486.1 Peptidase family M49 [Pontibacter ummariensis]